MEIPLDHFRLIGVSPSASSEEILRAFQLRLDKSPDEGFTFEVLTQRSELLRLTADLLTNAETRKEYENLVLNGASGLEFSSSREVAGLILLWESGSPKEAFKLARKALQPPQTPALGSSRESDLTLLSALTSRDAAIQEQEKRCYSNAAEFLQEGIHILQRMGKLTELRKNLEDDLSALLPYRILDYLSRDLSDIESHKKGLSMLENLIHKRGGLEGKNKIQDPESLNQFEFEAFFQQIKPFLTIQEQIDLFLNLHKKGSTEAGFLCFLSLTALGFVNRKPEKLFEAKKILKNLNLSGLDSMPLMGCLDLLLADVKKAEARFLSSSDDQLRNWLEDFQGENLEAIFLYCKNWLENDALKGYRDINIEEIDLNSWFEDRQVQEFIEKVEKKSSKSLTGEYIYRLGNNFKRIRVSENINELNNLDEDKNESNLPLPGGIKNENINLMINNEEILKNKFQEIYHFFYEKLSILKFTIGNLLHNKLSKRPSFRIYLYVFFILFGLGITQGFLRNNSRNDIGKNPTETPLIENNIEKKLISQNNEDVQIINNNSQLIDKNRTIEDDIQNIKTLNVISPTLDQVENLLNDWLKSKSLFLAGKGEINISNIVEKKLIERLNEERQIDINKNITKSISTEIKNIEFVSQSSSRIAVLVRLKYSEKILDKKGDVVSETSFSPFLRVKYILGFSNKSWKLVDYVSGV